MLCSIKSLIPTVIWDNTAPVVFSLIFLYVFMKLGIWAFTKWRKQKVMEKFANTKKDVVILHMFSRGKLIPSPSPFVMKMETYLRMAKIPYEIDTKNPFGPTNKIPWITLNGQHYGDTHLIIEMLRKKFQVKLGSSYTPEQKAKAVLVRIAIDEYLYWGGVLWRYVHHGGKDVHKIFSEPKNWFGMQLIRYKLHQMGKTLSWAQGLGRHSQKDVERMCCDTLRAISLIIGNNKFLLGDEPCEEDAAIFGLFSELMWTSLPETESPYTRLVDSELPNIRAYCHNVRNAFWPDWDDLLVKD